MKYFCLGNGMNLVKLEPSPKFFDNLPIVGTPPFGYMPVTRARATAAFEASEELVLCKSLEDANLLRHARIKVGNTNVTPEFFKGAIAQGYPLADFAIYEVEIGDGIETNFTRLREATVDQLEPLVTMDLYLEAQLGNRAGLPDIEICITNKRSIHPELINSHYLSLRDRHDEIAEESAGKCSIM